MAASEGSANGWAGPSAGMPDASGVTLCGPGLLAGVAAAASGCLVLSVRMPDLVMPPAWTLVAACAAAASAVATGSCWPEVASGSC